MKYLIILLFAWVPLSHASLPSLTIPANWRLIDNQAIFDKERRIHSGGLDYRYHYFDTKCYNKLKNWSASVVEAAALNRPRFQQCQQKLNIYGYAGFLPGDSVPPEIQELYLHWGATKALLPPIDKSVPNFGAISHDTNAALGAYAGYYAMFYEQFDYTQAQRQVVEDLFVNALLYVQPKHLIPAGKLNCDSRSINATAAGLSNGRISSEGCGTVLWAQVQGQLLLGLRLANQKLFDKGLATLDRLLHFFDEQGIYVPFAAGKGAHALDYMDTIPHYLGVITEILATLDYDFLNHVIPSGITIKQVLDGQTEIFTNHKTLLVYNAQDKGRYKGVGWQLKLLQQVTSEQAPSLFIYSWTLDEFQQWTPQQANALALYSWYLFARQSARYVDNYRPDLNKYRRDDYIAYAGNGIPMTTITRYSAIDPFMLYEANTKINKAKQVTNKQGSSFSYQPKVKASQAYVSASQRTKPISTNERLDALAVELTGVTADQAQAGEGFPLKEIKQQGHKIDWYIVKAGLLTEKAELKGTDTILLHENPNKLILSEKHFFPSPAYRKELEIWTYDDHTIMMQGELDYGYFSLTPTTHLKGNLKSGFGYGNVGPYGDILVFMIHKPQD